MKIAIVFSFFLCGQLTFAMADSSWQHLGVSPFYKAVSHQDVISLSREGLFKTMPGFLVNYSRSFYGANFLEVQAAFGSRMYRQKGAYIFSKEEHFAVFSLSTGIGNRIQIAPCFATSVGVGIGTSRGWLKTESMNGIQSLNLTQLFGRLGLKFHVQFSSKWSLNLSSQYRMGRFNWGNGFENAYQGGMLVEYISLARRF